MVLVKKSFNYIFSFILIFTFLVALSVQRVYASTTIQRFAGLDRYETGIKISQAGWQDGMGASVVLASGEDFPDALSADPLAKKLNAPILLTNRKTLDSALENELKRLQTKNIYIIGGYGAVSKEIETKLKQENYIITRLAGNDRYETAVRVAEYIVANFGASSQIVIVSGENFPDALSAAPIAANKGMPIILTPKDSLPDSVKAFIAQNGISKEYVIGGPGVVGVKALQTLTNYERVWGSDRYETNKAVLNKFKDSINYDKTYIASDINFPDALAGSALAAKSSSPIILASVNGVGVSDIIANTKAINNLFALGGDGVLTADVLQKAAETLGLDSIDYNSLHTLGNTPGNISNEGYAASQGDYVYYYQSNMGISNTGSIYKMKKDGTGKTRLCDTGSDRVPFINVVGDWIYYRYSTSETYYERESGRIIGQSLLYPGKLYKIKTDGTQNTKINDDNATEITVIDGWIYYMNSQYGPPDNTNVPGIYKVKVDGTGKVKLSSAGNTVHVTNISDGYIYYLDNGVGYRMKLDGTEKTEIKDGSFMVYGTKDWIYYIAGDFVFDSEIYKTKLDGSQRTSIYKGIPTGNWINLSSDFIYFATLRAVNGSMSDEATYRIKTDGTELTKISEDAARSLCLADDYIYYYFMDKSYRDSQTYRIKVDGTDRTNLEE